MTSPATIDRKTKHLLSAIAVLEGVENGTLASMCVEKLKGDVFAKARELRELTEPGPVKVTPWTDWNQRNSVRP
jgi:hypothetical protein